MRIYFEPADKDHIFYRIGTAIDGARGYKLSGAEKAIGEERLMKLIYKMETIFPTMTWNYTGIPYGFIFRFEGHEDYDYFTVWSSQGVEI
jgi:hypothetical protein